MAIRFKCSCGKIYTVKDELAGKVATCKACGKKVRIPTPKAAPAAAAPAPTAAPPQPSAAPPPPAPKAEGGRGKKLALIGGALALLLILGAAAFFIFGGKEEPKPKPKPAPVAKKPSAPRDMFPGESLVPANALVFASLPSFEESQKRFKETAIYQMTQDPALKGLTDPLMAMLKQKLAEAETKALQKTGLTTQDITTSFSKGFSLALMAPADPAKPDKPQTLVIAKPASMDQLDAIIAKMAEKSQAKQGEYEAEGVKVKSLSGKDGEVGYVALGELVAASDSKNVLAAAIRQHKAGRAGSLGADPHYAQVAKRLVGDASDFFLYVNGAQVVKEIAKKKPIPADAAAATGVNSLRAVAFAAAIRDKGIKDAFHVRIEGPKSGVFGILSPDPLGDGILKLVPQDAQGFLAGRMNLPFVYQEAKKMYTRGDPQKTAMWDQGVAMAGQMMGGMNIEQDLLPAFGSEFCFYARAGVPAGPLPIPELAIVLGVKDKAKLQPVLNMLEMLAGMKMGGGKPGAAPAGWQALEHAGETIKHTTLPLPVPVPVSPSYALTDKFLVISYSTQAVKSALDNLKKPGPGIAANEDFKHVSGVLSPGYGLVGYSNIKQGIAQAIATLPMAAPMLAAKGVPIDATKLPPPQEVAKHLFGGAIILKGEEDGLTVEGFSPVGAASGLLLPATLFPALGRARGEARKAVCKSNVKQLGLAVNMYMNDHDEKCPPKLEDLFDQYITARKVFVCPQDSKPMAIGKGLKCSYRYVGQLSKMTDPQAIVAYDKQGNHPDGRNALFYDGHVEWIAEGALRPRLQQSLALVKKAEWDKYPPDRQAEIEAFYTGAPGP